MLVSGLEPFDDTPVREHRHRAQHCLARDVMRNPVEHNPEYLHSYFVVENDLDGKRSQ